MQHGFPTDPTMLPSRPSSSGMQVDSSSSSLAAGGFCQQIHHSWPNASNAAAAGASHMMGPSLSMPLPEQQQQQPSGLSGATPADSYGNDNSSSSGSRLLLNPVTHHSGLQQLMPARSDPVKPRGRSGPKSKFSPYIGVSQYKRTGRWEAHIWDSSSSTKGSRATGKSGKGKQLHLGSFLTAAQAARAYDRAALLLRGPHAALNFPLGDYSNDPVLEELSHMSRTDLVLALRKTCDMEMEAAALEAFNAKVPAAAAHILHNITGPNPTPDPANMPDQQQQQLFGFMDLYGNTLDNDAVAVSAGAAGAVTEPDSMSYGAADMDGLQQQRQIDLGDNGMMMGCPPDYSQPLQQQQQQLQQQQQGLWLQQNGTPTGGRDALHNASPFHMPQLTEMPPAAAASGGRSTTFGSYWGQQDQQLPYQGESSLAMQLQQQQAAVGSGMQPIGASVSTTRHQAMPTTAPQQLFGTSSDRMQPVGTDTYNQQPQQQNLAPMHGSTPSGMPDYGPPPPTGTNSMPNTAFNSIGAPQDGIRQIIMPQQQQQQQLPVQPTSALFTAQSAPLPVVEMRPEVDNPYGYAHQQAELQQQHFQSPGTARLAPMASAPLSGLQGPSPSGYYTTDCGQCVGGTTTAGVELNSGHPIMPGSANSNPHTNSSRPPTPQTLPSPHPQQQQGHWSQPPTPSHTDHQMPARPHGPGMSFGSSTSSQLAAADSHTKAAAAAAVAAAQGGSEVWGKGPWQPSYISPAAPSPAVAAAGLRSWRTDSPHHHADSSNSSSGRTGGSSSNNTSSSEQQQQRIGAYPHHASQGYQPVAHLHHISSTDPLTSHLTHHQQHQQQQQQQQRVLYNEQPAQNTSQEQLSSLHPFQSSLQQQQQQRDRAVTRCSVSGSAGSAGGNESMPRSIQMMQHPASHQQRTAVHQQAHTQVEATLSPHPHVEATIVNTRHLSPQHGQQQQQQHLQQQQRESMVASRGLSPTAVVEGQLSDIHIAGLAFAHNSSMKPISSNTPAIVHSWPQKQQQQGQQQEEHAEVEVAIIPAITAGWHSAMRVWSSPSDEVHSNSHNSSAMPFTAAQHRPFGSNTSRLAAAAVRGSSQELPVDRRSTAGSNTNFHFSPPSPKHGLGHQRREPPSDMQHDQQQQRVGSARAHTPAANLGSREDYNTAAAWQSWQNQQQVRLLESQGPSIVAQLAGPSNGMTTSSNQQQQHLTLVGPPQLPTSGADGNAEWAHLLHIRSGSRTSDHHGTPNLVRSANLGQGSSIPDHLQDRAAPRSDSAENVVWRQHHSNGQVSGSPHVPAAAAAAAAATPKTAVPGGVFGSGPSATPLKSPLHAAAAAVEACDDGQAQAQQPSAGGETSHLDPAVPASDVSMDAKNGSKAVEAVGPVRTISNMTMSNLAPSRTVSSMVLAELARLASLSGSGDHDAATSQLVLQATSELAGNAEESQYFLQECQHLLYHQHSLPGLEQLDLLLMANGAVPLAHQLSQHGQLAEQQQQGRLVGTHTGEPAGPLSSAANPGTALSAAAAATSSIPPRVMIPELVPVQPDMPVTLNSAAAGSEASPVVTDGSSLQAWINSSKRSMLDHCTDGAGEGVRPAAKRPRSPAPGHIQANQVEAPGPSAMTADFAAALTATSQQTTAAASSGGPSNSAPAAADTMIGPTQHVRSQHGGVGWWEMMQM